MAHTNDSNREISTDADRETIYAIVRRDRTHLTLMDEGRGVAPGHMLIVSERDAMFNDVAPLELVAVVTAVSVVTGTDDDGPFDRILSICIVASDLGHGWTSHS